MSGKPKRNLSAYNLFFRVESERLIRAGVRVGFARLTKTISTKWNALDSKARKPFIDAALVDKDRYRTALAKWKAQMKAKTKNVKCNICRDTIDGDELSTVHSGIKSLPCDPHLMRNIALMQWTIIHQQQEILRDYSHELFKYANRSPSSEQVISTQTIAAPTRMANNCLITSMTRSSSHQDIHHDEFSPARTTGYHQSRTLNGSQDFIVDLDHPSFGCSVPHIGNSFSKASNIPPSYSTMALDGMIMPVPDIDDESELVSIASVFSSTNQDEENRELTELPVNVSFPPGISSRTDSQSEIIVFESARTPLFPEDKCGASVPFVGFRNIHEPQLESPLSAHGSEKTTETMPEKTGDQQFPVNAPMGFDLNDIFEDADPIDDHIYVKLDVSQDFTDLFEPLPLPPL